MRSIEQIEFIQEIYTTMIKKLLLVVMLCSAVLVQAQPAVGQWQIYPTKSTTPGIVYESTGDEPSGGRKYL